MSVILFNLVLDYITKKLGIREFFHLCLALTENVLKTPVFHRNLSFQLAHESLCQEFSPKPNWASSMTTSLIKHKQLSNWCMSKLQRLFLCTGGIRAVIQSQPLAKSRPNPCAWQTLSRTQQLWWRPPPTLPICTVHNRQLLLLEGLNLYLILLNVILPLSPPSISLIWFWTTIIGNISLVTNYENSISDEITHKIRQEITDYYGYEGFKTSELINKDIKKTVYMTLISLQWPVHVKPGQCWHRILTIL